MFNNTEDQAMIQKAKSCVKYSSYYPDKQHTLNKHKSTQKIFNENKIREIKFSYSSGRVSDNLMDKLIGPDK